MQDAEENALCAGLADYVSAHEDQAEAQGLQLAKDIAQVQHHLLLWIVQCCSWSGAMT